MIRLYLFLPLFLIINNLFFSCSGKVDCIIIYQNTGEIDRSYDVIESTFWDFKNSGDIDSLKITNSNEISNLYNIFKEAKKEAYLEKPFLHPEYAIILSYNRKNDTLYIEENLKEAYLVENKYMFEIKNGSLFDFFEENLLCGC